jgi:hypothetical protein
LAGIRAGETTSIAFPSMCSKRSVAVMEAEFKAVLTCLSFVHLPLRGQHRLGKWQFESTSTPSSPLFPVELQHANHAASTNNTYSRRFSLPFPYKMQGCPLTMSADMQNHTQQTQLDQVTERVERLLVRHLEVQRTNTLLTEQLALLTQERDSLKSRLSAARARVDALLERLPETTAETQGHV